jgi:NAD-dependent dihydropyrimidine dehydrogenase PreA subunit
MNYIYVYLIAILIIVTLYMKRYYRLHARDVATLEEAVQSGLVEPPSLHPVVDPSRCMGSGACAKACPEEAIGVINGKMALKNAAACIGHGACLVACPTEAIRLVFGTEKRGIDIPNISPDFETNVPGIFIAGELGGMGLIRKAAQQGREAMAAIKKKLGSAQPTMTTS